MANTTDGFDKVVRKKKKPELSDPPEADMLSFAAIMTILLAFFIMLSTFAGAPEEERSKEALESFKAALQNFGLSEIIFGSSDNIHNLIFVLSKTGGRSTSDDHQIINKSFTNLIDKEVDISYEREGRHTIFPTEIAFVDEGLELTIDSKAYLHNLVKLIKDRDCSIIVRGYTNENFVPTDEYPTSWQSSAEHAAAVTKYLHDKGKIKHKRLTAVGHGKYQKLAGGDPFLNKDAVNRINIIISNKRDL